MSKFNPWIDDPENIRNYQTEHANTPESKSKAVTKRMEAMRGIEMRRERQELADEYGPGDDIDTMFDYY